MTDTATAPEARDDKHFHIFNAAEKAMAVLREAGITKQEAFAAIAVMQAILIGHSLMSPSQTTQAMAYVAKQTKDMLPEMLEAGRKMAKAASN